jgi:hypothetical protein
MAKRGTVTDYAGDPLYKGDLVTYSARHGNRVRMSDAIVERVTANLVGGRLVPMLKVRPTGDESGFTARKTLRAEWIAAEHVRLITSGVVTEE